MDGAVPLDGLHLEQGGVHRLVQIGRVAVHPAVHAPPQMLLQLGVHDLHGGQRGPDGRQKVRDGLAGLKIGDIVGLPGGLLGLEAGLGQQGRQLPAHAVMGGHQLQVVALGRVVHRPPRQKSPPQKGRAVVVLLQHGKVDVVGQTHCRVGAVGLPDGRQLPRVRNEKDPLPGLRRFGGPVEVHLERLAEEGGQTLGKDRGAGDDFDLDGGKAVAEQEDSVGLRPGAAPARQRGPAQLLFDLRRKGHSVPPFTPPGYKRPVPTPGPGPPGRPAPRRAP